MSGPLRHQVHGTALTTSTLAPVARSMVALTSSADFALLHAMSFNAPLMRVKVDALAAAPLAIAAAVTEVARAGGAAWTEWAAITPAITTPVDLTPRLVKNFRNFSSARLTRILAASSLAPMAAPTSRKFLPSKKR